MPETRKAPEVVWLKRVVVGGCDVSYNVQPDGTAYVNPSASARDIFDAGYLSATNRRRQLPPQPITEVGENEHLELA